LRQVIGPCAEVRQRDRGVDQVADLLVQLENPVEVGGFLDPTHFHQAAVKDVESEREHLAVTSRLREGNGGLATDDRALVVALAASDLGFSGKELGTEAGCLG
jgi:hypothetical protein